RRQSTPSRKPSRRSRASPSACSEDEAWMKYAFVLAALLAGCATEPARTPAPVGTPSAPTSALPPEPPAKPAAPAENAAIAGLMQSARTDAAAGKLANA